MYTTTKLCTYRI